MHKYLTFLVFCLAASGFLQAQNFTYKAKVKTAPADGFYRVLLPAELCAYAAPALQDLRMMDNDGREIPFLLKKEDRDQPQTDFITYPMSEDHAASDWQTIIVSNTNKRKIDHIIFEMKNAETDRIVRISGSNDQQQWYVVRDRFYFITLGASLEANVQQQITFPATDYAYFKVEIKMRNQKPLNILRVGYSNTAYRQPVFQRVNGLRFQRSDSNKVTKLLCTCHPANRIDRLVFHISAPTLFKRTAFIKAVKQNDPSYAESGSLKSQSIKYRTEPASQSFVLDSESGLQIETFYFLSENKPEQFIIEIENLDNEPLKIDSLSAWQLSTTLTAEFKKDKTYFLYFGDSLLSAPVYDLVYFQNKIPENAPLLSTEAIHEKSIAVKDEYDQSHDKMLVWIGLGLMGLILFLLTGSMMKKMGKAE